MYLKITGLGCQRNSVPESNPKVTLLKHNAHAQHSMGFLLTKQNDPKKQVNQLAKTKTKMPPKDAILSSFFFQTQAQLYEMENAGISPTHVSQPTRQLIPVTPVVKQ